MQEIYVDDMGSGFPLVLVHGFLGSSAMWSPQKQFLSKHFRIISPALPGFGESSLANSLDSINSMAMNVLEIIKKKLFFNLGFKNRWEKILPKNILEKLNKTFKNDLNDLGYGINE